MGFDDLHRKRQGNLRKRKSEIKELELLRILRELKTHYIKILLKNIK